MKKSKVIMFVSVSVLGLSIAFSDTSYAAETPKCDQYTEVYYGEVHHGEVQHSEELKPMHHKNETFHMKVKGPTSGHTTSISVEEQAKAMGIDTTGKTDQQIMEEIEKVQIQELSKGLEEIGIPTEGMTNDEIYKAAKENNIMPKDMMFFRTAPFPQEMAKQMGIDTTGKTDQQIMEEIEKVQIQELSKGLEEIGIPTEGMTNDEIYKAAKENNIMPKDMMFFRTAPFPQEMAKQMGIDTTGKTDQQIMEEIEKVQIQELSKGLEEIGIPTEGMTNDEIYKAAKENNIMPKDMMFFRTAPFPQEMAKQMGIDTTGKTDQQIMEEIEKVQIQELSKGLEGIGISTEGMTNDEIYIAARENNIMPKDMMFFRTAPSPQEMAKQMGIDTTGKTDQQIMEEIEKVQIQELSKGLEEIGISTEGMTTDEIYIAARENNIMPKDMMFFRTAPSPQEMAKQMGIDTTGKTDQQIMEEIEKVQIQELSKGLEGIGIPTEGMTNDEIYIAARENNIFVTFEGSVQKKVIRP